MIFVPEGEDRLKFFDNLLSESESAQDIDREKLEEYYQQYRGSKKIDSSHYGDLIPEDAKIVRNITYELIESQVTTYIPTPEVSPKNYNEKNEQNAKSIETLLKNIRNNLPFERMNDIDERITPIYGGSVWLVEWDDSVRTHNTVGDVKITCLSPTQFVGQPHVYDIRDMEYCFVKFEASKEDIERKYGVKFDADGNPLGTDGDVESEGADERTATVYICYYRNAEDKVSEFVWSGDVVLMDIDDYYARKRKICKKCGEKEGLCKCPKPKFEFITDEYETLDRDINLSNGDTLPAYSPVIKDGIIETEAIEIPIVDPATGTMAIDDNGNVIREQVEVPKTEQTRIPFYSPSILPIVIRKNTSEEKNILGQSDCEFIRDQQQAINKVESRIIEKIIRSGVIPIVPDSYEGNIDNDILCNPIRVKQNEIGAFGRIDMQVDISRDVAEAERLYDHAKRILGISDSFQGQYDSSAQSGIAKQAQIRQAAGRLESKRQMKNAAYSDMDEIIFQFYLAYADEPRPAIYRDANGNWQNVQFNRYDFVERDEAGYYYYNDQYMFSADASGDIERDRATLWQENRLNFQSGAYGNPQLPQAQLMFWQNMERAHYPWAKDNVERIREEIEKQRQIEQMQAQLTQAQQDNATLQKEVENRAGYERYLAENLYKTMGGQG